jgi:hypothetical protein
MQGNDCRLCFSQQFQKCLRSESVLPSLLCDEYCTIGLRTRSSVLCDISPLVFNNWVLAARRIQSVGYLVRRLVVHLGSDKVLS